jgi:hypothetical protein
MTQFALGRMDSMTSWTSDELAQIDAADELQNEVVRYPS